MSLRSTLRLSSESELEQGTPEQVAARKRRDREELRKRQRLHLAEASRWPRIDLEALRFERYLVQDTRTGTKYRRYTGEVLEATDTPVVAWAITPDGPLFLEPA